MKRLKIALKAAIVPTILTIIFFIVGLVLFLVNISKNEILAIVGGLLAIGSIVSGCMTVSSTMKQMLHAVCPECQEFMGNSNKAVEYSFECCQYKDNYDSNNKYMNTTFYYTCSIICPHCGATSVFEYKVNSKSAAKADSLVNEYLKETLKIKK